MLINIRVNDRRPLIEIVKKRLKLSTEKEDWEIGFFPEARYKNGQLVAQVAFWNEHGTNHPGGKFYAMVKNERGKKEKRLIIVPPHKVPPRPFMKPTAEQYRGQALDIAARAIAEGKGEKAAMQLACRFLKDKIKQAIAELKDPPNSSLTILLKGSSNPLIDTGKMMRSVDFKKVDK